jgi:hypothetical protein
MFVDDVKYANLSAIVGLFGNEVIAPNVISVRGPKSYARAIGKPKPGSLRLLLRDLQPFLLPDGVNAISPNLEAF